MLRMDGSGLANDGNHQLHHDTWIFNGFSNINLKSDFVF